jgi:glycosyltransferase involved in cell wall biosynthesis
MVLEATKTITKSDLIVACIPAYNEDKTIASIIIKLRKYVDKIIVCDDGSHDLTSEIASFLGVELIHSDNNEGKGSSLRKLMECAASMNARVVVTLDADGQHDPADIPKLIEPILNNQADFVIGSRLVDGAHSDIPQYRKIGLHIANLFSRNGLEVKDTQSGFRAYSRQALVHICQCNSAGYGIETEQLFVASESGLRIKEVPINVHYNGLKTSKKNPISHGAVLVETGVKLVVEKRPLLFLGVPGIALIMIGAVATSFLLYYFNIDRYFSIPFALISLGAFVSGLFLVLTSLILHGIKAMKKNSN